MTDQRCLNGDSVVTPRAEFVLMAVHDIGSGISAEDLPFMFEHFYHTDQSRQRDQGGRRLCLSVIKHIVEVHQGQVWAKSKLGVGS